MTYQSGPTYWALMPAQYTSLRFSMAVGERDDGDVLCYGRACYAPTFWAMAVSVWIAMGLWIFAWRGPGGWKSRGVAV